MSYIYIYNSSQLTVIMENLRVWIIIISTFIGHTEGVVVNGILGSTVTLNCTLQGTITWKGPPNTLVYS